MRLIQEENIQQVVHLFKLKYGDDYPIVQLYHPSWMKPGIYSDHIIWMLIDEHNEIVATATVILDYGDYYDQIDDNRRLVVHPERNGLKLGRRIVNTLLEATDDTVGFAFGEARTVHSLSHALFERSAFVACGSVQQAYTFGDARERFVIYYNLYRNTRQIHRQDPPHAIPEQSPLSTHFL